MHMQGWMLGTYLLVQISFMLLFNPNQKSTCQCFWRCCRYRATATSSQVVLSMSSCCLSFFLVPPRLPLMENYLIYVRHN